MPETPLTALADASLPALALFIFLLTMAVLETAYRIGRRTIRHAEASEGLKTAASIITGGMLALFAFLLTVMFSMASDRYEKRRQSVLDEANAIGTAWLRAGLVGGEEGPAIQRLLHDYIPLRIDAVRNVASNDDEAAIAARTNAIQSQIWALATTIATRAPNPVSAVFVTSLNEMFDLATTNRRNFRHAVPAHVLRLVLAVAVFSVAAMGYQFGINGHRQASITVLLLLTWTVAIVLVVDIDSPRHGSVRVDPAPLRWTLESWGGA